MHTQDWEIFYVLHFKVFKFQLFTAVLGSKDCVRVSGKGTETTLQEFVFYFQFSITREALVNYWCFALLQFELA